MLMLETGSMNGQNDQNFHNTETWIFDLDNTLYPADCNLFAQIDERMGQFIADYLDLDFTEARRIQKQYYHDYGTTLSGLMQEHRLEPKAYLDYVHDIDLTPVEPSPRLVAALERLPGRRLIFTNGSLTHGTNVAERLGVLHLFEDVFDIGASDYIPKPDLRAYQKLLDAHNIDSRRSAMFEDMPHNLKEPHGLGMTTVLVESNYFDHPAQRELKESGMQPDYIHHVTDDLIAFLQSLEEKPGNGIAEGEGPVD